MYEIYKLLRGMGYLFIAVLALVILMIGFLLVSLIDKVLSIIDNRINILFDGMGG